MTINSGLRTLPQQLMLYTWMLRKQCRITAAAQPGILSCVVLVRCVCVCARVWVCGVPCACV
jgi:hypothetical protein